MSKIIIMTASREHNLHLSKKLQEKLTIREVSSDLLNILDLRLPLYTTEEQDEKGIPEVIIELTTKLNNADAFIFAFPEYNGGMPPSLVNAIAWFTRSSEKWRDFFLAKSVLLATHSGSGGIAVLSAMRLQLSYLGMNILGYQIQINFQKPLTEESLERGVSFLLRTISS